MTRPLFDMFNAVPRNYDLMNRLMTWGMDRKWRQAAAEKCLEASPDRVLDICCGTGDLSCTMAELVNNTVELVAIDYSPVMLEVARTKTEGLPGRPDLINGDASELPFADGCFDRVGISFAFRNLTYKNPKITAHLSEIFRIIRPGGRFVIIESSQPKSPMIRKLFHFYLRTWVSMLGTLISGNRGAYNYLTVSAANYYMPDEIKELLMNAGFKSVEYRPFFFGAAGLHVAVK